jgi:hypothetical protein
MKIVSCIYMHQYLLKIRMPSKTVTNDGREFYQTTVRIPLALHDLAKEHQISMSATLTKALENKFKCDGEESFPGGQSPEALPTTTSKRVRQ